MIKKEMKVAEVFERFPQTVPVFREFGFGALANPLLRKTFGKVTTVERGCRMHGVPLEPFLDALNQSLTRPYAPKEKPPVKGDCGCGRDEAQQDAALRNILKAKIGQLVQDHPSTRQVFVKHFGGGCFSCPAFGQEDVEFACGMHNADPGAFARECLEIIREGSPSTAASSTRRPEIPL